MPTSHDCEDDECVDGSAISPATVYVHVFRTSKNGTIVFEDEHRLELSVVHMYSCFVFISEVTAVSISGALEMRL